MFQKHQYPITKRPFLFIPILLITYLFHSTDSSSYSTFLPALQLSQGAALNCKLRCLKLRRFLIFLCKCKKFLFVLKYMKRVLAGPFPCIEVGNCNQSHTSESLTNYINDKDFNMGLRDSGIKCTFLHPNKEWLSLESEPLVQVIILLLTSIRMLTFTHRQM